MKMYNGIWQSMTCSTLCASVSVTALEHVKQMSPKYMQVDLSVLNSTAITYIRRAIAIARQVCSIFVVPDLVAVLLINVRPFGTQLRRALSHRLRLSNHALLVATKGGIYELTALGSAAALAAHLQCRSSSGEHAINGARARATTAPNAFELLPLDVVSET